MREGLNDVVPTRLLRGFSPEDLRRLVCGVDTLCPKVWRSATRHSDFGASASTSVQGGVGGVGDGARGTASVAPPVNESWAAMGRSLGASSSEVEDAAVRGELTRFKHRVVLMVGAALCTIIDVAPCISIEVALRARSHIHLGRGRPRRRG